MTQPAATTAPKSKFAEFLTAKKLDARRILLTSAKIEGLRPEDRAIRLARRQKKAGDGAAKPAEGAEKVKPRSGRPITQPALKAALIGKKISGPQKTRMLRAVNKLLEQKKQEPVGLDLLF
jgi:hypothetical protein